jgi:hypothetical protein
LTWPNWPFWPLIEDHHDPPELAVAHARPDRVDGVEHAGQVGVDHGLPLLRRHLVERRVAGDAGVGHHDVDGAQIGLDLGDPGLAGVVIGHVPLVGLDAGLGGELRRRLVVAGIVGRDRVAGGLQRLEIAAPMPREPPVTSATRPMFLLRV